MMVRDNCTVRLATGPAIRNLVSPATTFHESSVEEDYITYEHCGTNLVLSVFFSVTATAYGGLTAFLSAF